MQYCVLCKPKITTLLCFYIDAMLNCHYLYFVKAGLEYIFSPVSYAQSNKMDYRRQSHYRRDHCARTRETIGSPTSTADYRGTDSHRAFASPDRRRRGIWHTHSTVCADGTGRNQRVRWHTRAEA